MACSLQSQNVSRLTQNYPVYSGNLISVKSHFYIGDMFEFASKAPVQHHACASHALAKQCCLQFALSNQAPEKLKILNKCADLTWPEQQAETHGQGDCTRQVWGWTFLGPRSVSSCTASNDVYHANLALSEVSQLLSVDCPEES